MGMKRLENLVDNFFDNQTLNGVNGSMFVIKNPDRYYLEEYFNQKPQLNASIGVSTNLNFEILGTNAADVGVTYSSTLAGVNLATAGAVADQVIVLPHLDAGQSAWTGVLWGTENQVQWETTVTTGASIKASIHAGLKLTNGPAYTTDNDQAFFLYSSTDDAGSLTTNANLHFAYSIAGVDYVTDLGIAVAAATTYRLGVSIDSDRKVSAYVNGVQYSLTSISTAVTAGGVTAGGAGPGKSLALTNDVDLIPYVGVTARTDAATAKSIIVSNIKCSRIIFE